MSSIFRIAIVGAGPAGYFTAQAFQNSQNENLTFAIDMIERLPTPWGLVRNGVAPDHQKIKSVSKVFEKIATMKGFRLFANVELGRDVSLKDLKEQYDAVVLATGSSKGKELGIPGENLKNCISASDFVPWYNGHPEFVNLPVDLNCDTAVIIGAGNVALDIARLLTINPTELDQTDIANHALVNFKSSKLKKVIICGRRGPESASFTAPELRALIKLGNVNLFIDQEQIFQSITRVNEYSKFEKDIMNKLETMKSMASKVQNNASRDLEIRFLSAPVEIRGHEKVEEIILVKNEIKNGKVIATEKSETIKTGLVVTAIGYYTPNFTGIDVENGRIANIAGHVKNNIYVTGWAKRGPVGVIGTNKSDAKDVVELIIENLGEPKGNEGITTLLKSGHQIIDQTAWEKINASEVISGEISGKPRVKEIDWQRLVSLGRSK